jgi:hypothetical protein
LNLELLLDAMLGLGEIVKSVRFCGELRVASLADAKNWNILSSLYDSEFAIGHVGVFCISPQKAELGPANAKSHDCSLDKSIPSAQSDPTRQIGGAN